LHKVFGGRIFTSNFGLGKRTFHLKFGFGKRNFHILKMLSLSQSPLSNLEILLHFDSLQILLVTNDIGELLQLEQIKIKSN